MAGERECATGSPSKREDPGGAVDHRTVPATRLTTMPVSSLKLAEGAAVLREVGAEGIGDFGADRRSRPA